MSQAKANKVLFSIPNPDFSKISQRVSPIPKELIEKYRNSPEEKLIFSFRFLDTETDEFNLGGTQRVCDNWFIALLDTLKEISNIDRNELMKQRQHYDAHEHVWEDLKLKYKFSNEFLTQVECIQFRLSQSLGRVHGFVLGNRFYIVWLDPHHNLYPNDRFGGVKYFGRALNCYERLQQDVFDLRNELAKTKEELNDVWNLKIEEDNSLS